jgi:hypothetical protein
VRPLDPAFANFWPEKEADRKKTSALLARFKDRDPRRLRGDETWLYFFDPDNRLSNTM